MNWRVLGLAALAVLALALVGCGGGDTGPAGVTLTVDGTEFSFDPEQVTVESGQAATVNFTNSGSLEHNWVVVGADDPINTGLVGAGSEGSVTFTIDEPGEYTIVCDVPGHREAGMEGTLIVE